MAVAHAALSSRSERLEFRVVNTSGVECAALPQDVTLTVGTPVKGKFVLFDDFKDGKELCYISLRNGEVETVAITVKNPDGTDFPGSGLVEVDVSESYLTPDPPSPPPVTNTAPTASAVSISDGNGGQAVVGDTLTGNYTYSDANGDTEGTSTYRWLRNGSAIAGATGRTYTLVAADAGSSIIFEVTPIAAAGASPGTAVTSAGVNAVAANAAPVASAVSISDGNGGQAVVGDTLTGNYTYGDANGDTEGTSTYRWLRSGSAISGTTGRTYTLVAADAGHSITFEVTPVAAAGASPGTAVVSAGVNAVSVVQPSPTGKLNDTGITEAQCGNASANAACPQAGFPQQDGETGRDATQTINNDADGHRGFSFTKLDSVGAALADQSAAYASTPWACVKDNVTGLIWEVKTDDSQLHDKDWTYTWYDTNTATNGGDNGTANGGSCGGTSNCDTSSYVAAVNTAGWCGTRSGWRMPTEEELQSIADLSRNNPAIDTAYFPDNVSSGYWSETPFAGIASYAWLVSFNIGLDGLNYRYNGYAVRLVRSGH